MKPILFNTEMVKAILDGKKTVTRRMVKKDIANQFDVEHDNKTVVAFVEQSTGDSYSPVDVAPYKVGDILYVRETFRYVCIGEVTYEGEAIWIDEIIQYKASQNEFDEKYKGLIGEYYEWKPSIHMPKDIARIFLKVTNVRVERLQDINCEEALKEGCISDEKVRSDGRFLTERGVFIDLWNSTLKKQDLDKYGWNANPWVFVIEFEKIEGSEGNG